MGGEAMEVAVDDIHLKQEDGPHNPVLTPPASEENEKSGSYSSDLSELEEEEDIGDVEPAYYYEGGKVPVFEPTMKQFKDFKKFISKIDKYGMKSGIVKIVPPKEWRDSLPQLDEQVKTIRVKNPITQEFHGTHGTYTQANMEKQRSYNLPQWRALCEESNHQPPARRGERRRNQEKVVRGSATRGGSARMTRTTRSAAAPIAAPEESPARKPAARGRGKARGRGRGKSSTSKRRKLNDEVEEEEEEEDMQVPPTPTSPAPKSAKLKKSVESDVEGTPAKTKGRQPKSVTSRRKNNKTEQVDVIDEAAFKDFDYRIDNQDEWTAERCQELETAYWKGLTFNNPMYGADMPGSLFDDTTSCWNVAKLPNLLDIIGQKVPGVNTAYLYLGMWKATFAWHLEDVDLYSINYIHFGAPKQWYSISQADARRFENAMKNVWPNDAKNCDQFLRHKTYLISPQILKSQYNIEVNRLVHNEGEFVITYPYGYHSGYNLGYNCAESVNFATEEWLEYGRIAKKCECEADSVWIDVWDIERKLRGEPTPEYYEETDIDDDEPVDLPTPPASETGKKSKKRKREPKEVLPKPKKVKLKLRVAAARQPCLLCPNDYHFEELLPADNDKGQVHRRCAEYLPETWVSEGKDLTIACGVNNIGKARYDLRCHHCKAKHGASFQCSAKKCTRAYHATCAYAAGVQVDQGIISVYDENGTEYADSAFDFRCRFHRHKRQKYPDRQACVQALEDNSLIRKAVSKMNKGEIIQWQYYGTDIFAGLVLENRPGEKMLLVESIPNKHIMEVEYKWVLVLDKAYSHLQPPSDAAKPLPAHLQHKNCATEDPVTEVLKVDEPFFGPDNPEIVAEFTTYKPTALPTPKVDISKPKQLWYYLGKTSTEAKPQYTADPNSQVHDHKSNFLDSVRPVLPIPPPAQKASEIRRASYPAPYPTPSHLPPRPIQTPSIQASTPGPYNDLVKELSKAAQSDKNRGIFIGSAAGANNLTQHNGPWTKPGTNASSPVVNSTYAATSASKPASSSGYIYNKPLNFATGPAQRAAFAPMAQRSTQSPQSTYSSYQFPKPSISPANTAPHQQTFRFREHLGYKPSATGERIPSGSAKAPTTTTAAKTANMQGHARVGPASNDAAPTSSPSTAPSPTSFTSHHQQALRNVSGTSNITNNNTNHQQGTTALKPIDLSGISGMAPVSKR